MTRKRQPPHTYLTGMELQSLDILLRRAAQLLPPGDTALLLRLHARQLLDARYARTALLGVGSKLDALRRRAQDAERQRDDTARQLQAAEQELSARRTCEALALAVLGGWGVAGPEAESMRQEVRQALQLAGGTECTAGEWAARHEATS